MLKKKIDFILLFVSYLALVAGDRFKASPIPPALLQGMGALVLLVMGILLRTPVNVPMVVGVLVLMGIVVRSLVPLPDQVKEQWDISSETMALLTVTGIASYEVGGLWLSLVSIVVLLPLVFVMPASLSRGGDPKTIAQAAEFSRSAYGDARREDSSYVYSKDTGTLAGVSVQDDKIVVFFSGSASLLDFTQTNVDVASIDFPSDIPCDIDVRGSKVHRGFWQAYSSVRTRLMVLLTSTSLTHVDISKVLVTGHSLGGALASLAIADVCALFKDITLVTFGAPQVGNNTWATMVEGVVPREQVLRITTTFDPVPRSLGTIFRHPNGVNVLYDSPPSPMVAHDMKTYMAMSNPTKWYWTYLVVTIVVMILIVTVHHES
jgi:hypothetical protein